MNLLQAIANLIPTARKARVHLSYEPANLSANATVSAVQAAIRAAEAGDTRNLFTYYRDLIAGGSHVQAEFNKRKLAIIAQPLSILPADKSKPEDLRAAAAVTQMIRDCENWNDGLIHLLDSCLWPVAVSEKIFRPVARGDAADALGLRYTLHRFEPINPVLLCFRPKTPAVSNAPTPAETAPPAEWEPDIRLYATDSSGRVIYSYTEAYPLEPDRHIVHRGHLLTGLRDCFGGPMRAILFWWLVSTLARDWFARAMERYGVPFPVGHTDSKNQEAITFLQEAFSLASKIGGLVVDHDTQIELKEIAISGLADAHEKFLNVCNREISKIIVGQTLSAEAAPTGLGSGTASLQAAVREDIRMFDQLKLGETIAKQLFTQFLRINGLRGAAPKPVWGGLSDEDAKTLAELLEILSRAGLEPADESIPVINERLGLVIQRRVPAAPPSPSFSPAPQSTTALRTLAAQNAIAQSLGVPSSWLNPIQDFLADLQTKAADHSLSDQDLLDFLSAATRKIPELFDRMDHDDLARLLEAAMGQSILDEVRRQVRKNPDVAIRSGS